MSNLPAKSSEELEAVAAAVIGSIVVLLSRLEFNLGLYLRDAVSGSDPARANPLVTRLSFKGKLDALRDVVALVFENDPAASLELRSWLQSVDRFRKQRNAFVHGRWAFLFHSQEIINVSPGLPGPKQQREVRYRISDLNVVFDELKKLDAEFLRWSTKWSR